MQQIIPSSTGLVRTACRGEIDAIVAVIRAALDEFHGQIPPAIFQAYVEETSSIADRWEEAEVLVAELQGGIAGTVSFYSDASKAGFPTGWAGFRTLAVHPAARGQGLGRTLMRACLDKARDLGIPALGIHTGPFMKAAHRMYEEAGFRRSPEHDFRAAAVLDLPEGAGDVTVLAYRLDLAA